MHVRSWIWREKPWPSRRSNKRITDRRRFIFTRSTGRDRRSKRSVLQSEMLLNNTFKIGSRSLKSVDLRAVFRRWVGTGPSSGQTGAFDWTFLSNSIDSWEGGKGGMVRTTRREDSRVQGSTRSQDVPQAHTNCATSKRRVATSEEEADGTNQRSVPSTRPLKNHAPEETELVRRQGAGCGALERRTHAPLLAQGRLVCGVRSTIATRNHDHVARA